MTAYVGIDGVARKLAGGYVGIDGVARKVTKAYIGVDGVARLWWAAEEPSLPIVLEVAKQTITTYAGETEYPNEVCVLLDIYPKSAGSTVDVTYGGLTKTLTFSGTNAQQVFFGTFNGVSDSVTTPASGTLTIEGGCSGCGTGTYKDSGGTKASTRYCYCITEVRDLGSVTQIPKRAFMNCANLTFDELPNGLTSIGAEAFYSDQGYDAPVRTEITIPEGVESIGFNAFADYDPSVAKCYLTKLVMMPTTPPTLVKDLSDRVLGEIRGTIIVPKGFGDAYKAAEHWSVYADYITEAS